MSRLAVRAETSYAWDGEEISAGGSPYTKLDRTVIVSFLFHDGIVE